MLPCVLPCKRSLPQQENILSSQGTWFLEEADACATAVFWMTNKHSTPRANGILSYGRAVTDAGLGSPPCHPNVLLTPQADSNARSAPPGAEVVLAGTGDSRPPGRPSPLPRSNTLHQASCCVASPLIPPVPSPPGRRPPLLVLDASPQGALFLPCALSPARCARPPSPTQARHQRWEAQKQGPSWRRLGSPPPLTPADSPLWAPAPALSLLLELQGPTGSHSVTQTGVEWYDHGSLQPQSSSLRQGFAMLFRPILNSWAQAGRHLSLSKCCVFGGGLCFLRQRLVLSPRWECTDTIIAIYSLELPGSSDPLH
ncbi:hypothetical protein AAY473_036671 [Plecturocebus cupreus]